MSESSASTANSTQPERQEMMAALFAQLVMQQANLAMMLLGKVANPETGQKMKDLDSARLFIDQLEMLETKTKGNLTKDEAALLKQSLMTLRLAFVEAVEAPATAADRPPPAAGEKTEGPVADPGSSSPGGEEHPKKFSKKY